MGGVPLVQRAAGYIVPLPLAEALGDG